MDGGVTFYPRRLRICPAAREWDSRHRARPQHGRDPEGSRPGGSHCTVAYRTSERNLRDSSSARIPVAGERKPSRASAPAKTVRHQDTSPIR